MIPLAAIGFALATRALWTVAACAVLTFLGGCALTGDDLLTFGSSTSGLVGDADEHARRKFLKELDAMNEERAGQGLLPLDECSQCYWKHAGWAKTIGGCAARVRRWEFGDYTALDPPGVTLATTVPVVSDSVQAIYDERARNDRFLSSSTLEESGDFYSRRTFRRDLLLANAKRLQDGRLPLDLCSQCYWKRRRWAMKVDGCEKRIERWEAGDSTALDPPGLALSTTVPDLPDTSIGRSRQGP